ncbi:MAG: radical SAM protein [Acidobacteria bacterium]|nr:radical SAM protein [Acidobacteriota bacterium]
MRQPDYGPQRLTIELTNLCNLHCSYCLRDEDALYHTPANFFPLELLQRIIEEARATVGITHVTFTGGEVTLHPQFREILEAVGAAGLKSSFVTNGWHFGKVWPAIRANRDSVSHVTFSLDGATREAHDYWRGEGSFVRLVRAFAICHPDDFPFNVKVGIRRDTVPQLEQIAMFAARMGAQALSFSHIMPTSLSVEDESALDIDERARAEEEIAELRRIFKMLINIEVGYYNTDPVAPCSSLAGTNCNIDYRGRLSLCCNLSGFRGAVGEGDVVSDLATEDFATAYQRLRSVAEAQIERRQSLLFQLAEEGKTADLYTGSPCLLCLKSYGKIPWHDQPVNVNASRALPVMKSL